MKIMFVTPHLDLGGSERQIINLTKGLIQKNYEVILLLTDKKGDLIPELPNEVEVIFHTSRLRPNFFSRTLTIYKTARAKKPDILYSRLWTTKPSTVIVGKLLGIKTVLVEVNNVEKKLNLHLPNLIKKLIFLARKAAYKSAGTIIANSKGLAEQTMNYFNIRGRILTIKNGIDLKIIEENAKEIAEHPYFKSNVPIIVSVGRLTTQKGFSCLIKSVAIVNSKIPVRLIIIGGGELEDVLKKQAQILGISKEVSFIGFERNPHKYTAQCKIFVCSSLYEGFSNSLLEALALGLPIVSTDHDFGANEIIEDGKSGLLVPVADPKAMAEAILRVLTNDELRKKLSRNAREKARDFALEKTVSEYKKLFCEVVEEKK